MWTLFCVVVVLVSYNLGLVHSQGSSCPTGWHRHGDKCYTIIGAPFTWFDAREACIASGGRLVEIMDAQENMFIFNLLNSTYGTDPQCHNVWIGLDDFIVENQFVWQGSKDIPEYTNWKPGEPNNVHGTEGCVELDCSGRWNDANCEGGHFPSVCESSEVGNIIG